MAFHRGALSSFVDLCRFITVLVNGMDSSNTVAFLVVFLRARMKLNRLSRRPSPTSIFISSTLDARASRYGLHEERLIRVQIEE
jgi:hypothetical protein